MTKKNSNNSEKTRKNVFNYTNYYKRYQVYIGHPETLAEASRRFDQEKIHSLQHSYFCKASICVYHYSW